MILHTFILTLSSTGPIHDYGEQLRGFFAAKFNEYAGLHKHDADTFIHRYPVVQFRMIGNVPTVTGINEGAVFLRQISGENREIRFGETIYQIVGSGASLKDDEFGLSDTIHTYEFVTPWLALSQENYRKFYTLKGKGERDEFMRKMLVQNILSVAKSLGCDVPGPIRAEVNLHFRKERLEGVSVMTFTGKFRVNFLIPDLLGIGKSVSRGFAAVRQIAGKTEK